MLIMNEAFTGEIRERALSLFGLNLSSGQMNRMALYGEHLLAWNKKINLTALTDPHDIAVKHFLDSMAFGKAIEPLAEGNPALRLVDLGSGAGFPGIVLKIVWPSWNIELVDALNKRVAFLARTIELLELQGIACRQARAEDLGRELSFREKADIIVVRAVAELRVLLEYAFPLLRAGGHLIAGKGRRASEEIDQAQRALQVLGGEVERVERYTLGPEAEDRALIIIQKKSVTPAKYPRKAGVPVRNPL